MDYALAGFVIVAVLVILTFSPALAGAWDGASVVALAVLRTAIVLAASVVLLISVELTRDDPDPSGDGGTAVSMLVVMLGLLVGLFVVEEQVRRRDRQADPLGPDHE